MDGNLSSIKTSPKRNLTGADYILIPKVIKSFFNNFQMSLGWNDALSTDAVPIQCTKRNTEESHEATSVLPSERGFKLASLNINK